MRRTVDLRSDTVTQPTEEMRRAMAAAEVGDDGREGDPTVRRLEEQSAERLGTEAAMLVPSGTMGNLVSLLTHCERGDEVIMEAEAHTFTSEFGGLAALGGLIPRQVPGVRGALRPEDVEAAIRQPLTARPVSRLVCLENTHNHAGGTVIRREQVAAVVAVAHRRGLRVHIDGARIFNAAVALGTPARTLVTGVDSVTFCLSKALSAPVGSVVCGSRDFIARAREFRRMLGGTMRQSGIIAAAGIVALDTMVERLAEDHRRARRAAERLVELPGLRIDLDTVQTNIVNVDVSGLGTTAPEFLARAQSEGVQALPRNMRVVRLVTHRHIGDADVDYVVEAVKRIVA
ncbi:MAG: aminotransferase class I/II-fold pyridoxal phosphate-dependent enzyme [Chloroflexi bacterium]|nr:aminotransferase class I/II-fold pyridoxal phosphate-dependent enzyme [Chloroflexota bacterium]MBI4505442.1 aminotransferase class I/II-fold pyridoxal phosphate-dependent enzyme [Chloroflexota bacterium]